MVKFFQYSKDDIYISIEIPVAEDLYQFLRIWTFMKIFLNL